MTLDLKEGEAVDFPCRRCGSVSIRFRIRSGTTTAQCSKCSGFTRFEIELVLGGLAVKSRPVDGPPPDVKPGGREVPPPLA